MKASRVYWLLCAATVVLMVTSVARHLRGSAERGPDPTRGLLAATLAAKVAVVASPAAGVGAAALGSRVDEALDQAVAEGPAGTRARALRRKAIWCDFQGEPCAAAALDALETIPAADRVPAPADEVVVLREVLGGAPVAEARVPLLAARLDEIRLAWFDKLLRERLYRHAGDLARADLALSEARRSALAAVVAIGLFGALLGAGSVAWLVVLLLPGPRRVARVLGERLRARDALPEEAAVRLLAVVVAFLAAGLLLGPVAHRLGLRAPRAPLEGALRSLGAEVVVGAIAMAVHRGLPWGARGRPPALGFGGARLERAGLGGALVYLLLVPVIVGVLLPLSALFERLGVPTQSHPIVEQLQSAAGDLPALLTWFAVASVAAPLLEEAVFRGALQPALRAKLGGPWAVVLSSSVFAVIHPQLGVGLVGVLVIGLVLSLVREHEGSLWPSVVVHALNNGVALAVTIGLSSG